MFNLFKFNKKKNNKYVSCDLIEHGMDFFTDSIVFCCRIPPTDKGYKKILDNYYGEKIDWKSFFKIKRNYRNQMKNGNIIPECKNCVYLQEREWDDEDYISFINFNNWTICNEHCVYCWLNDPNQPHQKQYNVYPALKDMAEKGYLRKGGHITIAGGEPCSAPEFNDMINLFLEYDLNPIRVLTNASIYSDAVEKGIKSGNINIVVSVDSGTQEMFKQVKRRDFYHKVWENISRYCAVQPYPDRVKTKYIFIPNLNDNKEEVDAWVNKSIASGVKHLVIDVEMMYYNEYNGELPASTIEVFKYSVDLIKNKDLNLDFIDRGFLLAKKLGLN